MVAIAYDSSYVGDNDIAVASNMEAFVVSAQESRHKQLPNLSQPFTGALAMAEHCFSGKRATRRIDDDDYLDDNRFDPQSHGEGISARQARGILPFVKIMKGVEDLCIRTHAASTYADSRVDQSIKVVDTPGSPVCSYCKGEIANLYYTTNPGSRRPDHDDTMWYCPLCIINRPTPTHLPRANFEFRFASTIQLQGYIESLQEFMTAEAATTGVDGIRDDIIDVITNRVKSVVTNRHPNRLTV